MNLTGYRLKYHIYKFLVQYHKSVQNFGNISDNLVFKWSKYNKQKKNHEI